MIATRRNMVGTRRNMSCQFAPWLRYRRVKLVTAAEVVQYSFIVQNSISHLNLELSQSMRHRCSLSSDIIVTEEKCRKIFTESRSLLYTLHLDLPRGREKSLNSDISKPFDYGYEPDLLHIYKIYISSSVYDAVLVNIIKYACSYSSQSFKVLKWSMTLDAFKQYASHSPPAILVNCFVECIGSGFCDTEFAADCFKTLNFDHWLHNNQKPEKLESLLFHINQVERRQSLDYHSSSFKARCLLHYKYVGAVLKIQNDPVLDGFLLLYLPRVVRKNLFNMDDTQYKEVRTALELVNERRRTLLWHLLWAYISYIWDQIRNEIPPKRSDVYEALRLVWESIPDSFFSYEEIATAFDVIGSNMIGAIYYMYSEAVAEFESTVNPRPLGHFCKMAIRSRLVENKIWLPDGIKKTGLPPKLQSYLNLEKL